MWVRKKAPGNVWDLSLAPHLLKVDSFSSFSSKVALELSLILSPEPRTLPGTQ